MYRYLIVGNSYLVVLLFMESQHFLFSWLSCRTHLLAYTVQMEQLGVVWVWHTRSSLVIKIVFHFQVCFWKNVRIFSNVNPQGSNPHTPKKSLNAASDSNFCKTGSVIEFLHKWCGELFYWPPKECDLQQHMRGAFSFLNEKCAFTP